MKIWREKNKDTGKFEWHADFRVNLVRHRPVAGSRDELDEIIESIKKRGRQDKHGLEKEHVIVTIAELVAERAKDFDKSKKSHRHMLAIIELFRDYFEDDQFAVEQLKQAHLRGFVQSLKRKNPHLQGTSINTQLNSVNSLLHSAERNFPELESWKPPRMPFESVPDEGRTRIITEEEQARLFFELRAPRSRIGVIHPQLESERQVRSRHTVADLLDLALLTGMRNSEARTLHRDRVSLIIRTVRDVRSGQDVTTYGEVLLTKTKTGKKRKVPLNRDARELLSRRLAESACPWVFPNTAGTRPIAATVARYILKRAAAKAKVPYGQRTEDGFVFHDSRHTAATAMLHRGSDLKTIGAILGHTDETVTMRYSHDTPVSRAHAVNGLARAQQEGAEDKKRMSENEESDK